MVDEKEFSNSVVSLRHLGTLEFPLTLRATDKFRVIRNQVFVSESFPSSLYAFDLQNGKETARFHFWEGTELESFATDGEFFYLQLRGDFELRDSDVLIAKVMEWREMELEDGKKIRDGNCRFLGTAISELPIGNYIDGNAKDHEIKERICSFPLGAVIYPVVVYSPDMLLNKNTRFLVHEDMSLTKLFSGTDHVTVFYNEHLGEAGCGTCCRLKKGKLEEKCEETNEEWRLEIDRIREGYGFQASINSIDWEGIERKDKWIPLNIIFEEGKTPRGEERNILGIQHSDEKLHILYGQRRIDFKEYPGVYSVSGPATLVSYAVSLRKLSSEVVGK